MAAGRRATPGAAPPSIWRAPACTAYALDQRGHGDSDWIADGSYSFTDFAADADAVARKLHARTGHQSDRDRRLARRHLVVARRGNGAARGAASRFSPRWCWST